MIGLMIIGGLILGRLLVQIVGWQLRGDDQRTPATSTWTRWLPLVGSAELPRWLSLAIEIVTALMTAVLWQHYGLTPRFGLLLLATLVLIDTAAIDWQVKLIDTLVIMAATVIAVACAPLIVSSYTFGPWISSLLGLVSAGGLFLLFFVAAKVLYPGQSAPFGLGDVYLGMFIGALVGFFQVGPALFFGMVLAAGASVGMIAVLGYKRARHIPIAYGAFLCLGVLLHLAIRPVGS